MKKIIFMKIGTAVDDRVNAINKIRLLLDKVIRDESDAIVKVFPITADVKLMGLVNEMMYGTTGIADVETRLSVNIMPDMSECIAMIDEPMEFNNEYSDKLNLLFNTAPDFREYMTDRISVPIIFMTEHESKMDYSEILMRTISNTFDVKIIDIDKFIKKCVNKDKSIIKWFNK